MTRPVNFRTIEDVVGDEVVLLAFAREGLDDVLRAVINNFIGTKRLDQLDVGARASDGDMTAQDLRDLDLESADAAAAAVNEDFAARLDEGCDGLVGCRPAIPRVAASLGETPSGIGTQPSFVAMMYSPSVLKFGGAKLPKTASPGLS